MIPIANKVIEHKQQQQRVYPCRSNRASSLGHPCERYLVYQRTQWEKAQIPSVVREFIFDGGRNIEQLAIRELQDAGFTVTQQGRDFEMKEQGISGHIDGYISLNGSDSYPIEIKGISPFEFDKLNTSEDMLRSKKHYIRAYPAQLQLYLLMANKEEGLFYIKNKLTFMPKEIWMKLDMGFAESLLLKAETINVHIKNGTLPDRIDELTICQDCAFRHICLPPLDFGPGVEIVDSKELEEMLDKREELKSAHQEYEEIDERIKEKVEGHEKLMVGDWIITGKYIERTNYKVPKDIKEQYAEKSQYWKSTITKMTKDGEGKNK